jgi:hypothetical protein
MLAEPRVLLPWSDLVRCELWHSPPAVTTLWRFPHSPCPNEFSGLSVVSICPAFIMILYSHTRTHDLTWAVQFCSADPYHAF